MMDGLGGTLVVECTARSADKAEHQNDGDQGGCGGGSCHLGLGGGRSNEQVRTGLRKLSKVRFRVVQQVIEHKFGLKEEQRCERRPRDLRVVDSMSLEHRAGVAMKTVTVLFCWKRPRVEVRRQAQSGACSVLGGYQQEENHGWCPCTRCPAAEGRRIRCLHRFLSTGREVRQHMLWSDLRRKMWPREQRSWSHAGSILSAQVIQFVWLRCAPVRRATWTGRLSDGLSGVRATGVVSWGDELLQKEPIYNCDGRRYLIVLKLSSIDVIGQLGKRTFFRDFLWPVRWPRQFSSVVFFLKRPEYK